MEVSARNVLPGDLMLPVEKIAWKTPQGKQLPVVIKDGIVQVRSASKLYPIMIIPTGLKIAGTYFIVVHKKTNKSRLLYKGQNTQEGSMVTRMNGGDGRKQGMGFRGRIRKLLGITKLNSGNVKRLKKSANKLRKQAQASINSEKYQEFSKGIFSASDKMEKRGLELLSKGINQQGEFLLQKAKQSRSIVNQYRFANRAAKSRRQQRRETPNRVGKNFLRRGEFGIVGGRDQGWGKLN